MNTVILSIALAACALITLVAATKSFHDFSLTSIDGKPVQLAAYKGKVVLVVNVASECGYTKQYAGLEKLYAQYKNKGLVIIGVPSNEFGGQEPGTNEQIKQFCSTKFGVTFDMFGKIVVKGDGMHPLYQYLTSGGGNSALAGDISWNFEKFLISKNGSILKRYKSRTEPMSDDMIKDIEAALK